jgi:peptide deformylase
MSILKIVELPNKILRQKAKKVKVIDKKIKKLITDMQATLEAQADPEGVGLAAPQIGKSLRLFIVKYKDQRRVVINPKILSRSTPKKAAEVGKKHPLEGCLSLPHYYGPVKRPDKIKIKYQDEKGKNFPASWLASSLTRLTIWKVSSLSTTSSLKKHPSTSTIPKKTAGKR